MQGVVFVVKDDRDGKQLVDQWFLANAFHITSSTEFVGLWQQLLSEQSEVDLQQVRQRELERIVVENACNIFVEG